jgi:glycosyltransferase involved in cell wall biosynthesis
MGVRVSVIIPAFNLARYLPAAIDSALAQEPPGGPIEVIVVDDGSTDDTPQVLETYSDRVKVVRQPNRGLVGAVDRGLAEVRGEYVALLDADDEWPGDRLRRHVEILEANPLVGLVHGDMEVVDAHGETIHPSFFATQREPPTDGRVLGRLLAGNFVSGGASTFRSSLLPALRPIADDAAYPDWWIAACVAAVAEITHDCASANRYRFHGENMGLGSGPEYQAVIQRRELAWRRWMMWHLVDDDTVTAEDVRVALGAFKFGLMAAATSAEGGARTLLDVDRAAAARVRGSEASAGAFALRSKQLLRALSRDPFDGALAIDLEVAAIRDAQQHQQPAPPAPPLISLQARSRLTIAWLDELLSTPGLLRGFGEEALADDDCTLAVLAPRGADLQPLIRLAESDPVVGDERCDITVITEPLTTPARRLLVDRASSRLTLADSAEPYGVLPLDASAERALHASRRAA